MAQIALFLFFTMSFCLLMIGLKENRFRNMHVVGSTCSTHGESTRIENLVLCYSLDSPRTPRPLSMATIACSVSPVRYCFYGLDRLVPIFHYEFLSSHDWTEGRTGFVTCMLLAEPFIICLLYTWRKHKDRKIWYYATA